jgi:hypothetical protein
MTPQREIVWQFVRAEANYEGKEQWGIFRAYRYSPEYCNRFSELPSPT